MKLDYLQHERNLLEHLVSILLHALVNTPPFRATHPSKKKGERRCRRVKRRLLRERLQEAELCQSLVSKKIKAGGGAGGLSKKAHALMHAQLFRGVAFIRSVVQRGWVSVNIAERLLEGAMSRVCARLVDGEEEGLFVALTECSSERLEGLTRRVRVVVLRALELKTSDTQLDSDSDSTPSPSLMSIDPHPIMDGDIIGGSDSGESLYESFDEENSPDDQMDINIPPIQRDESDLAYYIKGMYRILDLVSEQGSGGLVSVDKIIIAQNSLKAFINSVCPNAYLSMTKVNFKALDKYIIKPVGVYGSKEEIVRFLLELAAIDETTYGIPLDYSSSLTWALCFDSATQLLVDSDAPARAQPALRSGLYIITAPDQTRGTRQIFVLYWPEQTTWDDSAASSVRRNRITFMRYLTKMCDQVVSLISSEHAQTILWSEDDGEDEDILEVDHDESDRMFTFEVAQTNEQEETVAVRKGFEVSSSWLCE
ncbi:hypothetical protein OG21DRAFT_1491997 [Imleria badia]|nr:hypothetical protein OG21DRAFT_1491997 [Imleria badia]